MTETSSDPRAKLRRNLSLDPLHTNRGNAKHHLPCRFEDFRGSAQHIIRHQVHVIENDHVRVETHFGNDLVDLLRGSEHSRKIWHRLLHDSAPSEQEATFVLQQHEIDRPDVGQ